MIDQRQVLEYVRENMDCVCVTSSQIKDLTHLAIEKDVNRKFGKENGFWVGEIICPTLAIVVDSGERIFIFEQCEPENCDREWTVIMSDEKVMFAGIMQLSNHCLRSALIQSSDPQDDDDLTFSLCNVVFSAIQNRLSNSEEYFEVEEKRVQKKKRKGKKAKGKGQRKVRLLKTYTLIRTKPLPAHKHGKITCPCWGVRGHYRHYQSGKVVFIEAYKKGKNRSCYQPKEYVITRKEVLA